MKNPGDIINGAWVTYTYTSSTDAKDYSAIDTKDINNDGRMDILLSPSEVLGNVVWYENPGNPLTNPSWTEHVVGTNISDAHAVHAADMDKDGDFDVVSSEFRSPGRLLVFHNTGGGLSWYEQVISANSLHNVVVGDIDADSDLDIFGTNSSTAEMWRNDLLFTPDTTTPTVSMTAPTGGSTVSGTIAVSANASDNVGVAGVQFLLDGAIFGAEDTTSPYSIVWNTTTATNGSHSLTATARDTAGNQTTSAAVAVTVSNIADTTPPTVSSVASPNITSNSATITWTTNEAADSQVEYGLTTSYGSQTTLDANLVTSHSVALSGLAANTIYNYRVKSKDTAGNLAVSSNFTFTTQISTQPPFTLVQSNVADSGNTITLNNVTAGNLIVIWVKWEEASLSGSASVTDGVSSFTMGTPAHFGTSRPSGQFGYLLSANGGNRTYTATFPTGDAFPRLRIAEFSYAGTISFDGQHIGSGSSISPASGNITTTGTNELVLGGYAEYSNGALSNPLINGQPATLIPGGSYTKMWYQNSSSAFTGNASATLNSDGGWVTNVIAFKLAPTT